MVHVLMLCLKSEKVTAASALTPRLHETASFPSTIHIYKCTEGRKGAGGGKDGGLWTGPTTERDTELNQHTLLLSH